MGAPHLRPDYPEASNPKRGPELQEPANPEQPNSSLRLTTVVSWVGTALVALVFVVCVGVLALLNSPSFHRYLRTTIEQRASRSLGVAVRLQEFTLHLSTLSLDLYGVTIHGANPHPDPRCCRFNTSRQEFGSFPFFNGSGISTRLRSIILWCRYWSIRMEIRIFLNLRAVAETAAIRAFLISESAIRFLVTARSSITISPQR